MLTVIGIDPGPVSGLARLTYREKTLTRVDALQCTAALLPELFERLAWEDAVWWQSSSSWSAAGRCGPVTTGLLPGI